jgi:hypothetical protein
MASQTRFVSKLHIVFKVEKFTSSQFSITPKFYNYYKKFIPIITCIGHLLL